jgi:hypothetical protein
VYIWHQTFNNQLDILEVLIVIRKSSSVNQNRQQTHTDNISIKHLIISWIYWKYMHSKFLENLLSSIY